MLLGANGEVLISQPQSGRSIPFSGAPARPLAVAAVTLEVGGEDGRDDLGSLVPTKTKHWKCSRFPVNTGVSQ